MSREFDIVNVFHYQLNLHVGQAWPQIISSLSYVDQTDVEFNASKAMFNS